MGTWRAGVAATCGECLAACGVVAGADGVLAGDPAHPLSRGYLCQNGKASAALVGHPARLEHPLVAGAPASWERALDSAARAIRAAQAHHPDAVGLYFGAGDPAGSLAFLAAAGLLQGLGSRRHYNVIGLEATHRYVVAEAMFGDPLLVPRPDLERAGSVLALGTNPLVSNDEAGLAEALGGLGRRGAALVVLDPRRTELARQADVHLQLRPGTDVAVLLAMLHVLFAERLVSPGLDRRMDGVLELRRLAEAMPPPRAAATADVPAAQIREAARTLAEARPVAILARLGTAMSRHASVVEWLGHALVAVLGDLGQPGGLVHNPGFLDFAGMLRRAPRSADAIMGVLPPAELADAILSEGRDRLRTLIVVAADPLESLPSTARVEAALARLDALIVLDVVPTATTRQAHVVLPAAHHLEKEDLHLLLPDRLPRRYVRISPPLSAPPGQARSEVAILSALAERLRTPLFGHRAIDAAARVATRLSGDTERPISPGGALRVVLPLLSRFEVTYARARRGHFGADGGRLDGRALVRRRVQLAPPKLLALARSALAEVAAPLVLSTCIRDRGFINGKLRAVGRGADTIVVRLSPGEAARRGLETGARATLTTRAGTAEVTVEIDEALRDGVLTAPFGSPGLNRLTDDRDRDPMSGIPALSRVPCEISSVACGLQPNTQGVPP